MLGYEGMYGGSAEQETGEKLYPFQTSVTLVRLIRIYFFFLKVYTERLWENLRFGLC